MEYLWVWKEKAVLFCKLSPKFETYECLVENFNSLGSTQTLHSFPADDFPMAGSPYFTIPEFRLRGKYTFTHCAFFLIPTLLHRPHSVCCPTLGTACSLLHLCLCAGWVGTLAALLVLPQSWAEKCVSSFVVCLAENTALAFLKYLGISKLALETEYMSLNTKR